MNLVLTIAIGADYQRLAGITHETIKKYAKKIGADFLSINSQQISKTTPHWEKFNIENLLDKYDRIFYVDTDIIIRQDCPNIFDIVPVDCLGVFNESPFTDRSKELMIDICKSYNKTLPDWDGAYYNTGVMVISKRHKNLFRKPEQEIFNFYEQSYLNMMIALLKIKISPLTHKFNRMTCVDRATGEQRFDSYIIHYAGCPNIEILYNIINKDLQEWSNKENYHYKKHLYISVTGGLGDQLCAEPAIRYLKENLYQDDEVVIATHFPRIFKHLSQVPGVRLCEHGHAELKDDTAYHISETLPSPSSVQWSLVSHMLCHTVDYSSIALLHRTLPLKDKTIKFEVEINDFAELYNATRGSNLKNCVVIHPGKHWDSKTFPVEYWQEIVDKLLKCNKNVVLIGKDEPGDPPDFIAGARGTVPIVARDGVIDLRNKISLGALGALLSQAETLVSNDSAPVHLAGAFDIKIILIPSCKHPDHILPYRNETQRYKSVALYKKLILDEIESRPTQVYETSVDVKVKNWEEYLPDVDEVINNIIK